MDLSLGTLPLQPAMTAILTSYEKIMQSESYDKSTFLLFESLDYIDQILSVLKIPNTVKYVYGVKGSDWLASKALLADIINGKGYHDIIPITYIPEREEDMADLVKNHDDSKIYIMKKNIQRQEGIIITRSLDEIMAKMKDYVVIQELLQNPYTISGRKINIRVYLLITVDKQCKFYIYNNGFMYYTSALYEPNSTDLDKNITTGYIDRQVYEENPLTIKDLETYLGKENFSILWTNLQKTIKKLKQCYTGLLVKNNKDIPGKKFLIYGLDVAVDSKFGVVLVELNKGPDIGPKSKRDKEVKENLVHDCFNLVGICDRGNKNNFIQIN
jgi:tubulin polyglutamylase TTLL1